MDLHTPRGCDEGGKHVMREAIKEAIRGAINSPADASLAVSS